MSDRKALVAEYRARLAARHERTQRAEAEHRDAMRARREAYRAYLTGKLDDDDKKRRNDMIARESDLEVKTSVLAACRHDELTEARLLIEVMTIAADGAL
jgi:hypothetical protein